MRKKNDSEVGNVKRTTILILGAGVMQIPAIRIAKGKNWKVIVADGNSNAIGAKEADVFEIVDLKNKEGLAEMAARHRDAGGLDGVFTAGTDFSASVAYVAEKLGLPGIPYETALDATDKSRMRGILSRKGIPCPKYRTVEKEDMEKISSMEWNFPLVVKPVDNMGARGVIRVNTVEELVKTAAKAMDLSRSGKVIVEDFIDGPEFSLDAVVHRGKVFVCGIADRHIHFPPVFVELGHTMPSRATKEIKEKVEAVFKDAVQALGITCGAAKGDVFFSAKGPMIGEIAARLSGGYMSGWTYPYASGVQVTEAALMIAVGDEPGDLFPKKNWTSAERAFISIPGTVEDIIGIEAARSVHGVKEFFCRIEKGAAVKFPENNVEKCGNVISALKEPEEAVRAAEDAVSKIFIRLRPSNPETEAFLFGSGRVSHLAYETSDDVLQTIESMPWWEEGTDTKTFKVGGFKIKMIEELPRGIRDWNKKAFEGELLFVMNTFPVKLSGNWMKDIVLGRSFWETFMRGGSQGAYWMLETLAECKNTNETREMLTRWKEAADSSFSCH